MYENELHIPKGTTCKIYVSIDENGEPYEPETGDVVRFGVKLDPEDTNFAVSKTADNFGGADNISFQRTDTANNTSSGYNVGSSRWGVTLKNNFNFSSSPFYKNRSSLRTWGFRVISGADMIFLDLYKYDNALLPYVQFGFMVGSDKATTWGNDGTERKLIKENYKLDGGALVHKLDRLPYVYNSQNPAQIEKINGKVFNTSGTDQPTIKITSLIDCSTVPYGSWWTVNNRRYYALDEHTLMEV